MVSALDPWGDIVVKISVEIKNFRFANVFEKDAKIEIPTSLIDLCKRDVQKHAFIREVEDLSREIKKQALDVFSIGFKKLTKKTVWFSGGINPYEFVVTTGKGVGVMLDQMFVYSEITISVSGELACGCKINVEIKEFSRGQSKSIPVNINGQASTYNLLNESDAFINSTIQATMRATRRALEGLTEQVEKCTSKGR